MLLAPEAGDEWPGGKDVLQTRFLSGPNSEGSAAPSETPEPFGPRNRVHSEAERLTQDNHPINDSAKAEKEKFTPHLQCRRLYLHRVGKGIVQRTRCPHSSMLPAGHKGFRDTEGGSQAAPREGHVGPLDRRDRRSLPPRLVTTQVGTSDLACPQRHVAAVHAKRRHAGKDSLVPSQFK